MPKVKKSSLSFQQSVRSLGILAIDKGMKFAKKFSSNSREKIRYWKKKVLQPSFHSQQLGGCRHFKFTEEEHQNFRVLLWIHAKEDPTKKLRDYQNSLEVYGYFVSKEFIRKIFVEWKWSWRVPSYKQIQKYTEKNLKRYSDYITWISSRNLLNLKFLDEVHFVAKSKVLIFYLIFISDRLF